MAPSNNRSAEAATETREESMRESMEERSAASALPTDLSDLAVSAALPIEAAPPRLTALGLGRIMSVDAEGKAEITVAGRIVAASVDPTVHVAVLRTAEQRGEPVLIEERGGSYVIVGALRTQPTPGVDKMETITLEADRIELKATQEIAMSSGVAAIALRAVGEVETYAERILSRAESVHKIVGRMLRLN